MTDTTHNPLHDDEVHEPVDFIHHTELPRTSLSRAIDTGLDRIGAIASWFWLVVMVLIISNVLMRYVLQGSNIKVEELQWHFYGAVWLLGLGYTLVHDGHVRVDLFHERFSLKTQAWIEILGISLLLLPFLLVATYYSVDYFYSALEKNEMSLNPSGLPYRWIIKFFMPLAMSLLFLAAIARLSRGLALIFGNPAKVEGDGMLQGGKSIAALALVLIAALVLMVLMSRVPGDYLAAMFASIDIDRTGWDFHAYMDNHLASRRGEVGLGGMFLWYGIFAAATAVLLFIAHKLGRR